MRQSLSTQYVFAFYWATLTMVGYGSTLNSTDLQFGLSLLAVILGAAIFVAIVGYMGYLINELGRALRKLSYLDPSRLNFLH